MQFYLRTAIGKRSAYDLMGCIHRDEVSKSLTHSSFRKEPYIKLGYLEIHWIDHG